MSTNTRLGKGIIIEFVDKNSIEYLGCCLLWHDCAKNSAMFIPPLM